MREATIRLRGSIDVNGYMESVGRLRRRIERIEERQAMYWLVRAKDKAEREQVRELYAQAFERLAKLGESD